MLRWLCPVELKEHKASLERSHFQRHETAGVQQTLNSTIEGEALELAKVRKDYFEFLSRNNHNSSPVNKPNSDGSGT